MTDNNLDTESKIESEPLIQQVPFYKCNECKFESPSGDQALEHLLLQEHKLRKIKKDRVVSIKKKIIGEVAHITKLDNDIHILCSKCNGSKS